MDLLLTYSTGIAGIIIVLAVVAFYVDAARKADRAEAAAADTSTRTTALAHGWLVQFKSGGSRWLPCLSLTRSLGSPQTFAIFATPGDAARYRDHRIKVEAERRTLVGDTGEAPAQQFRIVRARLQFD